MAKTFEDAKKETTFKDFKKELNKLGKIVQQMKRDVKK